MQTLVLCLGGLCTVVGAAFILLKDEVEALLWFGIPIQLLGMALIWMAVRTRKPVDPAVPPKPPGLWFPLGLGAILLLQFAYLIWWSKAGR